MDDTFQHQVLDFEMPSDDFDPNFIPEDGLQYLQQVVYERRNCPSIVVKPFTNTDCCQQTISWKKYFNNDIDDTASSSLQPTYEWKEIQIKEFSKIRKQINDLRKEFVANVPTNLPELPNDCEQNEWLEFCQHNQPQLRTMLQIDQPTLEILLDYQLEWLNGDDCTNLSDMYHWLGTWLYSTLACLHLPLEPNIHSILRQIARTCIRLKNQLTSEDIEKALPLNLLICIIAKNFNQTDLSKDLPINNIMLDNIC